MYTAGFEDSMKLLTASMSKEKKLDAAVKEFEVHVLELTIACNYDLITILEKNRFWFGCCSLYA